MASGRAGDRALFSCPQTAREDVGRPASSIRRGRGRFPSLKRRGMAHVTILLSTYRDDDLDGSPSIHMAFVWMLGCWLYFSEVCD